MSGDLVAGTCPTYAVVDKRKKKKVAEMDQESSADIALYAVVDKAKKKNVFSPDIHKNYDENGYSTAEVKCTESYATREEESKPTYSVLEKTSEVVSRKTSSLFNHFGDKDKKWNISGSISQVWLCLVIVIFAIAILVLAFGISAGVSYSMISILRAEISSNKSEAVEVLLNELVNRLNKSTILNYGLLEKRINVIEYATFGRSKFAAVPSCQAIHMLQPSFTSGYYWVMSSNGSSVRVYCDMTQFCGNVTGGLTRVARLNNETRPLLCIDNFTTTNENTRCVRSTENAGCSNIIFSVMNIPYSHICGTVQAFWFDSPDGFTGSQRPSRTINDNYVDGISLTYGTSNKTHIWTFIADGAGSNQNCPRQVPVYVGSDYTCLNPVYSCTSNSSSCYSPFFRLLQQPVTEDIELRLCRDQQRKGSGREGIYLGNLEIYVW